MPGVNSQGVTREEFLDNLRSALMEPFEMNYEAAMGVARGSLVVRNLVSTEALQRYLNLRSQD
ncbi:MAG: hypothetical protein F4X65_00710 [Chloroflexi bacterium]|nr:hypothetical protein [Chloroflexota bacterium]